MYYVRQSVISFCRMWHCGLVSVVIGYTNKSITDEVYNSGQGVIKLKQVILLTLRYVYQPLVAMSMALLKKMSLKLKLFR